MTRTSRTTAQVVAISGSDRGVVFRTPLSEELVPASKGRRVAAWLLDSLMMLPVLLVMGLLLAVPGVGWVAALLLVFGYMLFYNSTRGPGRSMGRASVGQKVVMEDGREATHGMLAARSLLRLVMWATVVPMIVDMFSVLFGEGRLLADRMLGTQVVEDPDLLELRASTSQPRRALARPSKKAGKSSEAAQRAQMQAKVEAEARRSGHEQQELDQIMDEMSYGADTRKDMEEFERRLTASMNALQSAPRPAAPSMKAQSAPTGGSTVFDFDEPEQAPVEEVVEVQRAL